MKPLRYTLIALTAACGFANAQTTATTTPVGYVTKVLPANFFSDMGLTLHNPVVAAGVLDAELPPSPPTPGSLTDNEVNFGTLLDANQRYMLELDDGTIQEIITWAGSNLDILEDITDKVVPGTTTYKLRRVSTISDIFGATNLAGLKADDGGGIVVPDKIYVPSGSTLTIVTYYDDGTDSGWFTDGGDPAEDFPLPYDGGFYIKRDTATATSPDPINLVMTGEVKTKPTSSTLALGWNYMSSVAPVGLTVGTSGLEHFLENASASQEDYEQVDNIYLVKDGALKVVYYYEGLGWFDNGGDDASTYPLEADFKILRRVPQDPAPVPDLKEYTLSVPSFYSTL